MPLHDLDGAISSSFYRRSNLEVPTLDDREWRLRVDGLCARPASFDLAALRSMPSVSVPILMECAGNGRNLMSPVPAGTPWDLGAVSTAVFTGVPLRALLERVAPASETVEILFHGADTGIVDGEAIHFQRSIPLPVALGEEPLLAWEMNGDPLPREHGYPLRLVMPGWYGIASVKWLTRIECIAEPFHGPFQGERYVYRQDPIEPDGAPVTRMRIRSLITNPADGAQSGSPVLLRGIAWSGVSPVATVEFSDDDGATWHPTELEPPAGPFAHSRWSATWVPSRQGEHMLLCRATDAAGHTQPLDPIWNELGYANNVVHRITIHVS